MKRLYSLSLALLLCYSSNAQNVVELGPAVGVTLPDIVTRNPDITKPLSGTQLGIKGDMLFPTSNKKLFFGVGLQAYVYYFSTVPSNEEVAAIGLFGLSFGVPVTMQHVFPVGNFALRTSLGVMPIIETSGLVRTDYPDGGMRLNAAPTASFGLTLGKRTTVGFDWFMPIRLYGAPSQSYTYRLHNFSFTVQYCLKQHRFQY